MEKVFDCVILGAGPAGLSASLILGRSRRNVALFDNGTNRNQVTQESHGFLTRDGVSPAEFRHLGIAELGKYPSVQFFKETVTQVTKQTSDQMFKTVTSRGREYLAERIILATGIQEKYPMVPEISKYYGKSLFSCPYCDGWELRDQPLIVIAEYEDAAYHMGKLISNWSNDLVIASNGHKISQHIWNDFDRKGISVITEPIKNLYGESGYLQKVVFTSGFEINRKGGFIAPSFYRPNQFAEHLGCQLQENGLVVTDDFNRTSQKNVYVAGEVARSAPSSLMIAAAEGNKAAVAVNTDITNERF
ncbi:NAD(P)/FAD-dependent oxidoreductase [Ornithinibacillus bavariensis]|uniref:Pyridine nucleotide-disulfide oxidoreductase n=1 Tax=Ornithinibacillus bavariensis TaxID=545502 RepID=A0A919X7I5_9BACI|nr:NAD(P)/FAD-dependent oxidoreductase [Ornithinibacillus bavariensis]GIO27411.1 pyridine nucleotide-disulfide oxidoreductase [Ornithinibacillus bavariensis]